MTGVLDRDTRTGPQPPAPPPAGPRPEPQPAPTAPDWMATVALAGLTGAAVLTLGRLFTDASFAGPWLTTVAVAHLVVATLRRRVPHTPARWALLLGIGTWAVLVASVPEHLQVGLPTTGTWDAVSAAMSEAGDVFAAEKAPVRLVPGFTLVGTAAIWIIAVVSDWALFRARARFEATVPALSAFVFGSVLGTGDRAVTSGVAMAAALVAVTAVTAHAAPTEPRWLAHRGRGRAWLASRTVAIGGVAVVAAALLAPLYPPADRALVQWRDEGSDDAPRVTVSPLVDIRGRLVQQSDAEMFRVRATAPAYWRLTALDRFDGRIWSSLGSYSSEDDELTTTTPRTVGKVTFGQEYVIASLSSLWLPAAWEATEVVGVPDARHDVLTGSLITAADTNAGLRYRITSARPVLDPDVLRTVPAATSGPSSESLVLPADFPSEVAALARDVAGDAGPYEQALALQTYFRSFTYALQVPAGHDSNDMVRFLRQRVGYCEQFAGTFAAMARSLGIPARVAVGFTPGDPVGADTYLVRGEHAHAWPEVHLDGVGWVPFEPTPGRGAPGAQAHTGVQPQQATPGEARGVTPVPDVTTPSTIPPSGTPDGGTTPTTVGGFSDPLAPPTASGPRDDATGAALDDLTRALAAVLVTALAVAVGATVLRRRSISTHRRLATGEAAVDLAWRETLADLRAARLPADPARTPHEHVGLLADRDGVDAEALEGLAERVVAVTYGPQAPSAEVGTEALALSSRVRTGLRASARRRDRLRWWLRPPRA